MKFWLPKETPGTDFQDLDMLPSLLAVPKPSSLERTKLVEELHNDETIDLTHIKFEQDENFEHSDDDLETDSTLLQLEQTIPEAPTLVILMNSKVFNLIMCTS